MKTLYLIQHNNIPEYTKIGYTTNLNQRIQQLQTASPTGIRLVYCIQCDYADKLEAHLHAKYSSKRTNLEWFALSHIDLVDIMFYLEEIVATRGIYLQKK